MNRSLVRVCACACRLQHGLRQLLRRSDPHGSIVARLLMLHELELLVAWVSDAQALAPGGMYLLDLTEPPFEGPHGERSVCCFPEAIALSPATTSATTFVAGVFYGRLRVYARVPCYNDSRIRCRQRLREFHVVVGC